MWTDRNQFPATQSDDQARSYWDDYYGRLRGSGLYPSQFAAFVFGELPAHVGIVDVGCGSGRDALFFASHGRQVIGVDASSAAIAACDRSAETLGLRDVRFLQASVDDPNFAATLAEANGWAIYARFFLHAITEQQEELFLDAAAALSAPFLAFEFRTEKDRDRAKITPSHYRRFSTKEAMIGRAEERGYDLLYAVEGLGLAKYGDDDAHVARCLFRR